MQRGSSSVTAYIFFVNNVQDDRCRLMRRTIMRYVNLSYVMILSMVSTRVKKRFPTLDHLVDAGMYDFPPIPRYLFFKS